MTFDATTEKVFSLLHPDVVARARVAGAALAAMGIYFRAFSGLRTAQQQRDEFAKGRDWLGHVIDQKAITTNAPPGRSSHNYGLAFDAVPFAHGASGTLDWNSNDPEYKTFVREMKAAGLKFGGDWVHMKGDDDHFYIGPDSPTLTMQTAFASGEPLSAIWASLDFPESGKSTSVLA
jgi:hypothetical protein